MAPLLYKNSLRYKQKRVTHKHKLYKIGTPIFYIVLQKMQKPTKFYLKRM